MANFQDDGTSPEVIDWFTNIVIGFISVSEYVLMKSVSRSDISLALDRFRAEIIFFTSISGISSSPDHH